MSTNQGITETLRFIRSVYGASNFVVDEARAAAWSAVLGDVPDDVLRAAVKSACATSKRPPTPADIIDATRNMPGAKGSAENTDYVRDVPVCVWDRDLELGVWLMLQGEQKHARMARNTLIAQYRTIEAAIDAHIAQISALDEPKDDLHHRHALGVARYHRPDGLIGWIVAMPTMHDDCARHWAHLNNRAHVTPEGHVETKGTRRVDFGAWEDA